MCYLINSLFKRSDIRKYTYCLHVTQVFPSFNEAINNREAGISNHQRIWRWLILIREVHLLFSLNIHSFSTIIICRSNIIIWSRKVSLYYVLFLVIFRIRMSSSPNQTYLPLHQQQPLAVTDKTASLPSLLQIPQRRIDEKSEIIFRVLERMTWTDEFSQQDSVMWFVFKGVMAVVCARQPHQMKFKIFLSISDLILTVSRLA